MKARRVAALNGDAERSARANRHRVRGTFQRLRDDHDAPHHSPAALGSQALPVDPATMIRRSTLLLSFFAIALAAAFAAPAGTSVDARTPFAARPDEAARQL